MIEKVNVSRRRLLQAGLAAGAGLALYDLSRLFLNRKVDAGTASLLAFSDSGMDDDRLAEALRLALQKGGTYADVFLESSLSNHASYNNQELESAHMESLGGAAVRLIKGDQVYFVATNTVSPEGLRQAAREVAGAAATGAPTKAGTLRPMPKPGFYPEPTGAIFDALDKQYELIEKILSGLKGVDPKIRGGHIDYVNGARFTVVATSTGVVARDAQPSLKVAVAAVAKDLMTGKSGLGQFSAGGHYGLEFFEQYTPEDIGKRAGEAARHQLDAVEAPAGEMPVVLGAGYSGVLLHEAVGHGLEADFNVKGYSLYANRIGQMVASPLCTIYDDGRRPNLNGSINFDDEGVPPATTLLIDRGRLTGYMHSRETALKMGADLTGNGRRQSYRFPPLPRMTNTYLQAGDTAPDEIIASVKRGIYAKSFTGGSVNITTGDFAFVPMEASLIESGRITSPLLNVILLGNGPEILNRVSMVGRDMRISESLSDCSKAGQAVPVTVGTPTLKVDRMTVGGTFSAD